MSVQTSRITRLEVGKPSGTPSADDQEGWEVIEIRFHDLLSVRDKKGEKVTSPEFTCFGYRLSFSILPGGCEYCSKGKICFFLHNLTKNKPGIKVKVTVSIRDTVGEETVDWGASTIDLNKNMGGFGRCNLTYYSKILGSIVRGGTLSVEVRMKQIDVWRSSVPFIPKNPLCNNILKRFMDEESADVVFEVSSGNNEMMKDSSGKRAKTTTTFYAHRLILQDGAPALAELCKASGGVGAVVPISNIRPDIFRHLLYYVYGGEVSGEELDANAKDVIEAADRYGVVNLKLQAEAIYVKSNNFTTENILDNLLYADAKNCALLKEAAMDFIVKKKIDIMDKVSFDSVPSSMMKDLLAAMARGEAEVDSDDDYKKTQTSNYNKLRVGTLRRMLHAKGLDVDGSRETMILRLKEN